MPAHKLSAHIQCFEHCVRAIGAIMEAKESFKHAPSNDLNSVLNENFHKTPTTPGIRLLQGDDLAHHLCWAVKHCIPWDKVCPAPAESGAERIVGVG